jgi:hypothetical protein
VKESLVSMIIANYLKATTIMNKLALKETYLKAISLSIRNDSLKTYPLLSIA